MPITFSEQFNVPSSVLESTGVFDVILDVDTRVFIDPALFELLGVFQEDIGCDRVSDLITFILSEEILQYTQRVVTLADIPNIKVHFGLRQ